MAFRELWDRLRGFRRLVGACPACGENETTYGARVCKSCLKTARRIAREEAGEAGGPRGRYRTLQGFVVASEGEAAIADHLFSNGVLCQYEPAIGSYRPDFLVPASRVVIEYFGMSNADYNARRREKEAFYAAEGYRVIAIQRKDLARIGVLLSGLGEAPAGLRAELKRQRDATRT